MIMSDITNPPMDDDQDGSASPDVATGDQNTANPPMDDDADSGSSPRSDIENPPA